MSNEQTIRARIIAEADACIGQTDGGPFIREAAPVYGPNDKPSFCGIAVRAWWRRAGLKVRDWLMSDANLSYLQKTKTPQPADLIMWRGDKGHQSLFDHFDPDGIHVWSVDANTTGKDAAGKWHASIVATKKRKIGEVLAYYRAPIETANVDEGQAATPPKGAA